MSESFVRSKLYEILINEAPMPVPLTDWEDGIIRLLGKPVKRKYSELINKLLEKVRINYFKEMHNFRLRRTLSFVEEETEDRKMENVLLKSSCSTDFIESHAAHFTKYRKSFGKRFFLSHELIRYIVNTLYKNLPCIFFNLEDYKSTEVLTITEVSSKMKGDIKNIGLIITKIYYQKIVKFMTGLSALKSAKKECVSQLLRSAVFLFVQLILNIMIHTINKLIDSMKIASNYPCMELNLIYEHNRVSLKPSFSDIYSTFHGIIDDVANVTQELISLEHWANIDTDNYIQIKLPDWFLEDSHARLQIVMENTFQSMKKHCERIGAQFAGIYTNSTENEQNEPSLDNFHILCGRVEKLNDYLFQAKALVTKVYCNVGTLMQHEVRTSLQECISGAANSIIEKLITYHQNYTLSICLEFDALESKALNIPNNTKSLFDLCDYVSHASKVVLQDLEERLRNSVNMLVPLLQVATLTTEHLKLNKRTINWLSSIQDVFTQSNTLCESMKSVLEDELQKRVNIVNQKIDQIIPEMIILDDMDDAKRVREYVGYVAALTDKIVILEEEIKWINLEEKLFKFPETTFPKIIEVKEIIAPFNSLVHLVRLWQRDHAVWMSGPFEYLDATVIEKKTLHYFEELTKINNTFKMKIKTEMILNKAFKFSGVVDDPDPMQRPAPLKLCWQALRDLDTFQRYIPLVICMCNKSLEKRHWDEMSAIAGFDLTPNAGTTLGKIIAWNLFDDLHKYQIISTSANKQLALRNKLKGLVEEWKTVDFTILRQERTNCVSFIHYDHIDALLEEHILKVKEMKCSHFVHYIESEVDSFLQSLECLRKIVETWPCLQEEVNSVHILLSNKASISALKEEMSLYEIVKSILMDIQERIVLYPSFEQLVGNIEITKKMQEASDKMKVIMKGIKNYLKESRFLFPRLFFLTDKEIINLLDFKNEQIFHATIAKCFHGVKRLRINENLDISAIVGELNEKIVLCNKMPNSVNIKNKELMFHWLVLLEKQLLSTIKQKIKDLYNYCKNQSIDEAINKLLGSIQTEPGMVINCVWKIIWTAQMEHCFYETFKIDDLKLYHNKQQNFTATMINQLKNNISRRNKTVLMALITNIIYEGNLSMQLINENDDGRDFRWQIQLRYYFDDGNVRASVMDTSIMYAYEYHGLQKSIVTTPSTERCHHALIIAYHHNISACILGTAGTGKVETIKSLAEMLGMLLHTFNYNDNLDFDFIRNVFMGFALCGSWICFKNFCCIKPEFSFIIGQYISQINETKRTNSQFTSIGDISLKLNTSAFFIATMNPGCAEKLKLLDETKRNFRMVSIMKPHLQQIIEVRLLAAGCADDKKLSLKLTAVYEYLSKLTMANFGTESILQVVNMIVNQKICSCQESEDVLLLRSIIDVYLPKVNESDIPIFLNLIQDTFPNTILPTPNYTNLLKTAEQVCTEKCLNLHDSFKLKFMQLFEMIHLKSALIITGDPFGGKTTILRVLADVFSLMAQTDSTLKDQVQMHMINPNAVTFDRLYGYCGRDMSTTKWIDGILTTISDTFIKDKAVNWKWMVFDGNMQNSWMETMQSFLTDSSVFLPSGQRLFFPKKTIVIFETSSLQDVSPSFVSKCGVVFMETPNWLTYVVPEVQHFYPNYADIILPVLKWTINACLQFLQKMCSTIIDTQEMHLIMSAWKLFKVFFDHMFEVNAKEKEIKKENVMAWCQASIVTAIVWGLAGSLDIESQTSFDAFCVALWTDSNTEFPRPKDIKQFDNFSLNASSLREYFYVPKGSGSWKHCGDVLKNETIVETPLDFGEYFVPTIDSVRISTFLRYHVKYRQPFLLCSNATCGKTAIVKYIFENKLNEMECNSNYCHLTPSMTVNDVQNFFLAKMIKMNSNNYGSRNKLCINFVDDLHVMVDKNPIVPTLELIRQYLDHNFWYDVNKPRKIYLHSTMFSSALTSEKKKIKICPRFLRHFNMYAVHPLSKNNMCRIFTQILFAKLKQNLFTDVLGSVNSIVNATLDVYCNIIQSLRPIPSNFQYRFNLRNMSQVIHGCSLIHKESVESKVTFIRVWVHEVFRVFGDRMLNQEDRNYLFVKIKDAVKANFKDSFESVFDYLKNGKDELTVDSFMHFFFGDFMESNKDTGNVMRYEEITSLTALKNKISSYINEHNENNTRKIDYVLTNHFLEHLVKICRILTISGGNVLIISCHGSGRKALTKLASFIKRQHFFEPFVSPTNNLSEWKNDLKDVLQMSGIFKTNVTFFCKDWQTQNQHLEDISCLLQFGQIPQLFSDHEWQVIVRKVRLSAQGGDRNMEMAVNKVKEYFVCQCMQNLHFVLCLNSLEKNKLRSVLYDFPNLLSCCQVDWWENWPDVALQQVAVNYFKNLQLNQDLKSSSEEACRYFYNYMMKNSINKYLPVPETFIRMIHLYANLVTKNQEKLKTTRNEYLHGLEKLEFAETRVVEMKTELTMLREQLEISAQQTDATRKEIERDNVSIEKTTVLVKADEEVANKKAAVAAMLKTECEAELAVAIPILEDAVAALNTLKPTDITLVKAMKNPPDTIKLVMAAVCVMLEVPSEKIIDPVTGKKTSDYWGPSKRVLSDMNFLQNLKDYDKDNISPTVMQTIKKTYMTDANFQPRIVAKASSAAEGLCKWVRAMVSYDEVAKIVAPKKEKLAAVKKECDLAEAYLNEKRKILTDLKNKMSVLKDTLKTTLSKKQKLEAEVASCAVKLETSESLIKSLVGEKERWIKSAEDLQTNLNNVAGDMILSSGIVTYLPSVELNRRQSIVNAWQKTIQKMNIPYSENYDIVKVLGSEIKVNSWHLCGLSKDPSSVQNAFILEHSLLWTYLLMDPHAIASQWVKNVQKDRYGLNTVRTFDSDYMNVIRHNMEIGIPVLIENVDCKSIQALTSIICQTYYGNSEAMYINFQRSVINFNPNFRLYVTTNLNGLQNVIADVFNKMVVVDFSLHTDALQDQLLNILISIERPKLYTEYETLVLQSAANKKMIKEEESNILKILSASDDNILEDDAAINMLNVSKNLFVESILQEKSSENVNNEMDLFRKAYRSFVEYCSDLYNLTNVLSKVNYMYRFSLSWFTALYVRSLHNSRTSSNFEKRMSYLKMSFTQHFHSSVQRALFEEDKIIFSFLLSTRKLLDDKVVTESEIDFFINIDSFTEIDDKCSGTVISKDPGISWIPEKSWKQICYMSQNLMALQSLPNSIKLNSLAWQSFYELHEPQNHALPSPWNDNLTTFQKLIILRILRSDKVITAIIRFVDEIVGHSSDFGLQSNLAKSYLESTYLTPIIFILPSYSSPLNSVYSHHRTIGCSSRIINLFMGQSRTEEEAERCIEEGRKKGDWIFLHNCHLAVSWLQKLGTIYEQFEAPNTSLDFRLWLSSQSTPEFPVNLLQSGIKLVHDTPTDLKQTLSRTYHSEPLSNRLFFNTCSSKSKAFSKLVYGLCFFHGIIAQRRMFSHRSWNVCYEFEESDFIISWSLLHHFVKNDDKVPFQMLLYLFGECTYGGKILDTFDAECLKTLLKNYCNSELVGQQNYSFLWSKSSEVYVVPKRSEYRDCIKFIDKFIPQRSSAEVFGLDEAAEIIRNSNRLNKFTGVLLRIDKSNYSENEPEKESQVLFIIKSISDTLPDNFNVDQVRRKYIFDYYQPLNDALCEELKRYNEIMNTVREDLDEVRCFYEGRAADKVRVEELARQLYIGEVPLTWKMNNALCYTRRSLSAFITELCERLRFIKDWEDKGHPRAFWLRALTSSPALFLALKLTYSRRKNISVNEVEFNYEVERNTSLEGSTCENEILFYGLYLSGATWNVHRWVLDDSLPKVIYQNMPKIRFHVVPKRNDSFSDQHLKYDCPLYVSSMGRNLNVSKIAKFCNYICSISLSSEVDSECWVRKGTALYCDIN